MFDASILTGPVANYPVADSFNRALERDYSTGDIPHVFVSSVVWDLPFGDGRARQPPGRVGAHRQRLDADVDRHAAVGRAGRGHADHQLQRVRRLRRRSGRISSAIRRCRPIERTAARGSTRRPSPSRRSSRIGSASRNPVRGPVVPQRRLALTRGFRSGRARRSKCAPRSSTCSNTPPLGNPNAVLGAANFGTITTAGDPRVVQLAVKLLF